MRFSVADVFLPNPEGVFVAVPGEDEVEGTIVDFSDSGRNARVFAVVEVVRCQKLIVPVDKLRMTLAP